MRTMHPQSRTLAPLSPEPLAPFTAGSWTPGPLDPWTLGPLNPGNPSALSQRPRRPITARTASIKYRGRPIRRGGGSICDRLRTGGWRSPESGYDTFATRRRSATLARRAAPALAWETARARTRPTRPMAPARRLRPASERRHRRRPEDRGTSSCRWRGPPLAIRQRPRPCVTKRSFARLATREPTMTCLSPCGTCAAKGATASRAGSRRSIAASSRSACARTSCGTAARARGRPCTRAPRRPPTRMRTSSSSGAQQPSTRQAAPWQSPRLPPRTSERWRAPATSGKPPAAPATRSATCSSATRARRFRSA